MNGLEILTSEKAIKKASDTAENLIKGLFGSAFNETGEMIADQVRLRRFKNQIKILEKAKKNLSESEFDQQKINLKVLAPLIEFSSYEEDENLQEMWANLIKNVLSKPFPIILQQNAISVLNKISNEEANILNQVYKELEKKREKRANDENRMRLQQLWRDETYKKKISSDYKVDLFSFSVKDISKHLKIDIDYFETLISNLIALGTLKYETEVEITSAEKSSEDPEDKELEIELDVTDYDYIKMTKLGFVFVELCQQ